LIYLRVAREIYVRVFSEGDGAVEENIGVNIGIAKYVLWP
jgi:hypothetical protein